MVLRADLEIPAIVDALGEQACHFAVGLVEQCTSTNSLLLARAEAGAATGSVIVARHQSAGRGRRGREWISGPGDSLTFSLLWRLPTGVQPAGLSLAAGLAVVRALQRVLMLGLADRAPDHDGIPWHDAKPRLKWPNDILLKGRKLGGILVELLPGASHTAVIGYGLNLALPVSMADDLRASSAALDEAAQAHGKDLNPNEVLAAILIESQHAFGQFARQGFSGLQAEWMKYDVFRDKPVRVLSEFAPTLDGICRGVTQDGGLRLEVDGTIQVVLSGEVSLRLAP